MTPNCRCGATWTGKRVEHCTECHQSFTGTASGDKHRVGKHDVFTGPQRRRCLSVEEMETKGMKRNKHGHWGSGGLSPWAAGAVSA